MTAIAIRYKELLTRDERVSTPNVDWFSSSVPPLPLGPIRTGAGVPNALWADGQVCVQSYAHQYDATDWLREAIGTGISRSPSASLNLLVLSSHTTNFFQGVTWLNSWATVDEWSELEDDWDGEEAVAPSADVLKAARRFIRLAEPAGLPEGSPYIAADGEIGFRWRAHGSVATLSFLATGELFAYCPPPVDYGVERKLADAGRLGGFMHVLREFLA